MDIKYLITVGGPLGVLVVVVWIFVNTWRTVAMEHRAWMESLTKNMTEVMKALHEDHISARNEAKFCIEKNTEALTENTKAMGAVAWSVRYGQNEKKP